MGKCKWSIATIEWTMAAAPWTKILEKRERRRHGGQPLRPKSRSRIRRRRDLFMLWMPDMSPSGIFYISKVNSSSGPTSRSNCRRNRKEKSGSKSTNRAEHIKRWRKESLFIVSVSRRRRPSLLLIKTVPNGIVSAARPANQQNPPATAALLTFHFKKMISALCC